MTKNKTVLTSFVLIVGTCILLMNCKGKDGAPGPAGKDAGSLTGDLAGSISLYDEFGNTILGVNNTYIEVEGSDPLITYTPTDQNFTISGLKTGTYRLKFINSGYGTTYSNTFQFIGGDFIFRDQSLNQKIFQLPTTKIVSLSMITIDSSSYYSYSITFTGKLDKAVTDQEPRSIVLYIGDNEFVNSSNYVKYIVKNVTDGDGSFITVLFVSKYDFPFNHMYVQAYVQAINATSYLSIDSGLNVISSLSEPSNTIFIK